MHKNSDSHPDNPTRSKVAVGIDKDEFDNAETTEIVMMDVRPVEDDGAGEFPEEAISEASGLATEPRPTEDDALEPGYVLSDRFEIVELIYSSAMGRIYKAIDRRRHGDDASHSHVAIKIMRRSVAPQDTVRLALEREAAKAQYLSHPNIINIFDFDEHDGHFYLVMEWLQGESVNALLRRTSGQRLAPQFAWQVIQETAAAVQHAHSNDIVHADINPSNIFITETREIKLLDFGVARDCGDSEETSDDRLAWATQTYASPEVLSGAKPVFEDDVFSLGCVAYRLLSGTHPFDGKSSLEAMQAGIEVQPISGLAESEWQVLGRALSYERADRPRTAAAFARRPESANEAAPGARIPARLLSYWPLVAAAVIAVAAGSWWLSQGGPQSETLPAAQTAAVDAPSTDVAAPAETSIETASADAPPSETSAPDVASIETVSEAQSSSGQPDVMPATSELDALLSRAIQAMDEARLTEPAEDNARFYYREALAIEPADPLALSGLRAISDMYLQQSTEAISTDDPVRAAATLAVAAETDADNPAIAITNDLLQAQGDRQLAEARLAAAEGDFGRAAELLAGAERYAHIDANALDEISLQIAAGAQEEQLADNAELTDTNIAATPMLAPVNDDAPASLPEVSEEAVPPVIAQVENDPPVTPGTEIPAAVSPAEPIPLASSEAALTLPGVPVDDASNYASAAVGAAEAAAPAPVASASSVPDEPSPAETSIPDIPPPAQERTMAELGIKRFVPPTFPRAAKRRGQTGYVDVGFNIRPDGSTGDIDVLRAEPSEIFDDSARRAVEKWRFAQRDDVVRARVTLRYTLEP